MKRSDAVSAACTLCIVLLALALGRFIPRRRLNRPSRALRPDRRRSRRSGQAHGRQRHPRIAPSDVATAIKFCKTASAAHVERFTNSGAPTQPTSNYGSGRCWRKAADKGSTSAMVELGVMLGTGLGFPRTRPRRASCSSALPRPAIRAASPTLRRSSSGTRRRIPSRRHPCWRKRRRQIQRKRSINSV